MTVLLFVPGHEVEEFYDYTGFGFRQRNDADTFPENTYLYCCLSKVWGVVQDREMKINNTVYLRRWGEVVEEQVPKEYRLHVLLLGD